MWSNTEEPGQETKERGERMEATEQREVWMRSRMSWKIRAVAQNMGWTMSRERSRISPGEF